MPSLRERPHPGCLSVAMLRGGGQHALTSAISPLPRQILKVKTETPDNLVVRRALVFPEPKRHRLRHPARLRTTGSTPRWVAVT